MHYRVAWRHPETTRVWVGQFVFSSLQAADEVARSMDMTWPETKHWPVSGDGAAEQTDGLTEDFISMSRRDGARSAI